jgi:hypothetical protein
VLASRAGTPYAPSGHGVVVGPEIGGRYTAASPAAETAISSAPRSLPHPPDYAWEPQPKAQALVNEWAASFLAACPFAATLSDRMTHATGTRFRDWIDFIELPAGEHLESRVLDAGFTMKREDGGRLYEHDGGLFPQVVLSATEHVQLGIKVDSVSDFLAAWSITNDYAIEGEPFAAMRRVPVACEPHATMWAVERHGCRTLCAEPTDAPRCLNAMKHFEALRRRKREWDTDVQAWARLDLLVDAAIADLGGDHACDLFFRAERDYWQRRNRAARVQKARQDELGLGWANHDHHTYRSSREGFSSLIAVLERLGFVCRERFYAGAEAGWGAQVLEQPECRLVIFADVDLSESEVAGDFAHTGLEPAEALGTVGLWVGLHGESMLQAGLHHLECQFDFEGLRDQLKSAGVGTMPPFTSLPYLRQAFTEGERWPVAETRLLRLLEAGLITPMQANQFRMQGAIGSHLENLERHDGYKGFNQHGVSDIIGRTDPRRQIVEGELLGA